ncbi:MAG: M48 family metallopeptidase [Rhodanobacteraceae bacterium]|jgi:Zn-dependent protease with chaperone function|nr:MAG: M48 family metallopeptidase [Rhodanobacteraceae bacterium]
MDFFAQQAKVRRSSRTLVWLFALAVLAIVVAVDLVCAFVLGVGLRPAPLLGIAVAVVVVIGLCSAYRVASLAGGGAAVAREMNATEVPADTTNPQWQRLRNVIEEVAIASGVPVPEIYVMQDEPGINAFAAGYTPTDAVVCVTQGCLDKLNRDELQGVIAHEFSHVLNGDMRLNIRLMGLLFGIMAVWVVGRFLLWGGYFGLGDGDGRRRRGGGGSGQVALAGVALLAIGAIGVFFGRLIQAAVSRSRESLADASAVQFTRQTSGIAGALKKIAVFEEGSALQAARRDEVRHMLFGDAEQSSWFATHPPITERIKALEPGFKPEELDAYVKQWLASGGDPDSIELHATMQPWEKAVHAFAQRDGDVDIRSTPPAQADGIGGAIPARGAELAITAAGVAAQVAAPGTDDYRAATDLRAGMPAALAAAARDPRGALAVVFALAISEHSDLMAQQVQSVTQAFDVALGDATRSLVAQMADLHPMLRLPLAQLAFPALKRRPRPEVDLFVKTLDALIHADGRVDLDEYCLAKLVRAQVVAALDPSASFKPGTLKLTEAQDELRDFAALVARFGNDDDDTARRAFQAAMQDALPNAGVMYALPEDWQAALDRALDTLSRLRPEGKELVVQALVRAIAVDGKVTLAESELLRVACAVLGCPLPPLLADQAG